MTGVGQMTSQAERAQPAEPGRVYPAWRDGRSIPAGRGPRLHAVTGRPAGDPLHSGFLALCGRSVRFAVLDEFDPDDDESCLACAVAVLLANG